MASTVFPIDRKDLIEGLGKGLRVIEATAHEHILAGLRLSKDVDDSASEVGAGRRVGAREGEAEHRGDGDDSTGIR